MKTPQGKVIFFKPTITLTIESPILRINVSDTCRESIINDIEKCIGGYKKRTVPVYIKSKYCLFRKSIYTKNIIQKPMEEALKTFCKIVNTLFSKRYYNIRADVYTEPIEEHVYPNFIYIDAKTSLNGIATSALKYRPVASATLAILRQGWQFILDGAYRTKSGKKFLKECNSACNRKTRRHIYLVKALKNTTNVFNTTIYKEMTGGFCLTPLHLPYLVKLSQYVLGMHPANINNPDTRGIYGSKYDGFLSWSTSHKDFTYVKKVYAGDIRCEFSSRNVNIHEG